MRDTMTMKEAAEALAVTSTNSVRRILSLQTAEGRTLAHVGYDGAGRQLVRREVVMQAARKRARRGNWRVANLGSWAEPRTEQGDSSPDESDGSLEGDAFIIV